MGNQAQASTPSEPMGLVYRLIGVLFSPTETFKNVVASPRWPGMLVLISLTGAVFTGGFLSTEVLQEAWLEGAIRSAGERAGGELSEAQIESLNRIQPYLGWMGAAQGLLGVPAVNLLLSGVLFLAFGVFLGATASFRQLFTVLVHSGAVGIVQQLFTWPLNYFRGAISSPSTVAVFLFTLDEDTFVYKFFNAIDLFIIWWLVVVSIGLGVLYKKRAKSISVALFAVYGVIAFVIASFF